LAKEQVNWYIAQCILLNKLASLAENYRQANTAILVPDACQKKQWLVYRQTTARDLGVRLPSAEKNLKNNRTEQQKLTIKIVLLPQELTLWQVALSAKK